MTLTTLQFWKQQQTLYTTGRTAAQADLKACQEAQQAAGKKLADDLQILDQSNTDIAKKRTQLAVTTVPADAGALVGEITALMITQRRYQGLVLDDQGALDAALASLDIAKAASSRIQAKLADIQAKIVQAQTEDEVRKDLRKAVTTAPLSTLKAAVTTYQGSATVTANAPNGLKKSFPDKILEIAGLRYQRRLDAIQKLHDSLTKAQEALGTDLDADGGLDGAVSRRWSDFTRAQDRLARYVATAANRYGRAQATLTMLEAIALDGTGTVPHLLSAAQEAQVAATSTLGIAGLAAEPLAVALDPDLGTVYQAQADLDAQVLIQIAADVDSLTTDPTLAGKRDALKKASDDFNQALGKYATDPPPHKADMDHWEAIVPDTAWRVLVDYQDALAALADLAASDPTQLLKDLDDAEDAYTKALGDAEKARRRAAAYADAVALRDQHLSAAQAAFPARLFSAIRGDTY